MSLRTFGRDTPTRSIHRRARGALPALSQTEREALDAGAVWWEAEFFTGSPDWAQLRAIASARPSSGSSTVPAARFAR